MKMKLLLAMLILFAMLASCKKDQPLTPTDSSDVTPSFLYEGEPVNPPPPPSDDGGNPFEIG